MEALSGNPLVLIGLIAALAVLILLARRRGPRRIGMNDGRGAGSGAVSRARRSPDRTPPPKQHGRHTADWRTDAPVSARKMTEARAAGSLHERIARLQEIAQKSGRKPTPDEALSVVVGSQEAKKALPLIFRVATLAVWAWMGIWGFSAVMILLSLANGDADEGALIGLGFLVIPLAIGFAALRAIRNIRGRIEKRLRGGNN
jgi:hypothetical protein